MIEFKLPFLGADVETAKLLEWKVQPGDAVKRGQVVAVVDTSKAAVDVESWQEGTVLELLVQAGQSVSVGTVLATLGGAGESPGSAHSEPSAPLAAPVAPAPQLAPSGAPPARRRISPAARKYAEDSGIAIENVSGTGPDGAVTLQDVARLEAHGQADAADGPAAGLDTRRETMRQAIAAAMSRSKREIPHYYLSETVPMQKAQQWLTAANASRGMAERLLMAVLQLKAVALAAKKYPDMNGFCVDGIFRPATAVHIGVAISLRQGGLIAPAIHDVADKSVDELMRDLADLVKRARAGSLRSSEMSDPTLTVTNLGEQGVEAVYGVIYPPQVALLGFGRIREAPWVHEGGLSVMPVLTASLAADHRVSDGHYGALFLAEVGRRLQEPEQF